MGDKLNAKLKVPKFIFKFEFYYIKQNVTFLQNVIKTVIRRVRRISDNGLNNASNYEFQILKQENLTIRKAIQLIVKTQLVLRH